MNTAAPTIQVSESRKIASNVSANVSATASIEGLRRVNLGCGPDAPANWINVDGSWNAWFTHHPALRKFFESIGLFRKGSGAQWKVQPLVHDITKPLPFTTNSVTAIYGSHVLEHLYRSDAVQLLAECKRVLKPGGILRLVVPDVQTMARNYLASKGSHREANDHGEDESAADLLNDQLGFRSPAPPSGSFIFKFYAIWKDFHHHKWMYDADSLARLMTGAGFSHVSEKGFCQSDIPGIEEVEVGPRVLNGVGACVEGKKP
jgi:SAM-dependent methyltransferase